MALKKRGGVYHIDLTVRGRRVQKSARTADKGQAQEYHDRLKADLWRETALGEKPKRQWWEAVSRWSRETVHKRSHERDAGRLRILDPYMGHLGLADLTRDRIDDVAARLAADRGISGPAVNRYLALIRSILRRAEREWGWIERAPAIRLHPERRGRIRWLTRAEYTRLMRALPDHLKGPVEFTLQTGLRQSNVFRLRWEQVDLQRRVAWVEGADSKTGKALRVPLNDKAVTVLKAHRGIHPEWVFTHNGQPVTLTSKVWKRVLKEAEISDFRFHDLRHTWASWRIMAGTSLQELMELAGWATYDMALRYAHLAPGHLDRAATDVEAPGDSAPQGLCAGDKRHESKGLPGDTGT